MSLHEDLRRSERPEGSSDRAFGLVVAAFCGLMAGIRVWSTGALPLAWIALGLAFLLPALVYPAVLRPLNRAWTAFGLLLAKVTTPVILGVLFFGCFAPIGFLARLCRRDFLSLKRDPAASSYWVERDPSPPPPGGMKNQF